MKTHKVIPLIVICLALIASAVAQTPSKPKPIFPESFAGWQRTSVQAGTDPATVDPAQSRVLKEYGFTDFETATYTKDGRTLKLKAARFKDASGAYGAFTFYREPKMLSENVGSMAVSLNERVLFFRDYLLVDATFDHMTGMSGSELRELAGMLPSSDTKLPDLPQYLPREKMVANTGRYIIGPAAYDALRLPAPAQLVAFDKDPEILDAKFKTSDGESDLILIKYPTPAIAIDRQRAFEAANPHTPNSTYEVKRTGPILTLAIGSISQSDARSLLGKVNYEAEVTWNEATGLSKRENIGALVVGAFTLAFIIFAISVGWGVLFGFGRSILNRIFPGRFAPKTSETEFIRLNLR